MFNPYFQNLQNYGTQAQNYIPYNTLYNAPQGGNNQLIRVTGLDGAKAYQMAANSTVALFDSNEDIMYVKTTDGAGFGTIRAFSFSEIDLSATAKPTPTEYVTKDEFEKLRNEVQSYAEQFISKPKTAKSKSIADDSAV